VGCSWAAGAGIVMVISPFSVIYNVNIKSIF
jgi:hypothetical protein